MNETLAATTRRRTCFWLSVIGVPLLIVWALAGCFMEGEDELERIVPWLVVLGGGVEHERIQLACQLFSQGHGYQDVVLTGRDTEHPTRNRAAFARHCGIPTEPLHQWPETASTFDEMYAVAILLSANPGRQAIVVSDALHMSRLRYLRDRLALNGRVFFRQSRLGGRLDPAYLVAVSVFRFREPLVYVFYRLRY